MLQAESISITCKYHHL